MPKIKNIWDVNKTEEMKKGIIFENPDLNELLSRKDKFILDENNNVVPATILEWGEFFEKDDRIVKQEIINDYFVSTVFLGIDYNFCWRK